MSTEPETPAVVDAEGPHLKRPLVSVDPNTGESWYLFQLRFLHANVTYATTIYARSDAEALDIVESMKATAMLDSRLSPIVRRAADTGAEG